MAIAAAATAVVALVALAMRQRRSQDPLVPSALLRDRSALGANLAGFLFGGLMLGRFLLLTLAMQVGLGYSTTRAGLGLVAARAASVASCARRSARSGLLSARVHARRRHGRDGGGVRQLRSDRRRLGLRDHVLPGLVVLGLGIPLLFVSSAAIAVERIPSERAGVESAC